jgi:hypothetical protein
MAYYFPEGSSIQFSNTLASAKTISAATNANPAVLTSTAHGYVTGDEVLFVSGWEDATDSVYKVTVIDANSFSLQGLNTSNTSFFPAGSGTGTTQELSAWSAVPQVLNISTSGGDARFTTVSPLAKRNDINVPTGFNALSMTLTLGHDPSNATYQTMLDISRTLSKVSFKLVLGGGGTMYGHGYMSVAEAPTLARNQANQVNAAITVLGRAISYS